MRIILDDVIDLSRFLSLLHELGYGGYLSLELFNEGYWSRNPLEVAREGMSKLRALLSG